MTLEDRFWSKVDKSGDCWEWTGYRVGGYGRLLVRGVNCRAPRIAWGLARSAIPPGLQVLHHCDNPPCVNPAHLFLGTHADNMADKSRKGRTARGSAHGMARLTEADVAQIRELALSDETLDAIASRFGVSSGNVSKVVLRRTWRHVKTATGDKP